MPSVAWIMKPMIGIFFVYDAARNETSAENAQT